MPICTTTTEWIRETISKPVEEWEKHTEEKCKKKSWWNPLKYLCYLVTYFVKVIRWVVVTVVRAVVSTVCRLIVAVLGVIWDLLKGLGLLLKALVTWDKCTLQEALGNLGNAVGRAILFPGQTIWMPFGDFVREWQIRGYVRDQIEKRFADRPAVAEALKKNFHVDAGVFGYRLTCKVHRLFVDSQRMTERFPDVFNLAGLHDAGDIDLMVLAGFEGSEGCAIWSTKSWYRPRPQTGVFPFASGGGGDAEPPKLKREQLQEYIDSHGSKGPHFLIYAMHKKNLEKRTDSASEKGRQLGLILDFEVLDHEVKDPRFMDYSTGVQPEFLKSELGRLDEDTNAEGARQQLCAPAAAGVFRFGDSVRRGVTNNLFGTTVCGQDFDLSDDDVSGVSFIDDIPDELRRYVLIHELGHYFGLCHVDGGHHIMVSGAEGQGDAFTWDTIPNLFFHGGPWFERWEAEQVWDFILDHFTESCLGAPGPPDGPFMGTRSEGTGFTPVG